MLLMKILIPMRPGITEYSSLLRRNLTNNEWTIRQLEILDIRKAKVELVNTGEGWFGTLTEAKSMSRLFVERGYQNVLLISSPEHTVRLNMSFESYLKKSGIRVFVKGSDEVSLLRNLIIEFGKLKIYQYLLVPFSHYKSMAMRETL